MALTTRPLGFDQAGRSIVADTQLALHTGYRGAAALGDIVNRLIVQRIVFVVAIRGTGLQLTRGDRRAAALVEQPLDIQGFAAPLQSATTRCTSSSEQNAPWTRLERRCPEAGTAYPHDPAVARHHLVENGPESIFEDTWKAIGWEYWP